MKIKALPIVTLVGCLGLLATGHRAPAQIQTTGNITRYVKQAHGISGTTNNGIFSVEMYNAHTIRVRVSQHKTLNDFSYLLQEGAQPNFDKFTVTEEGTNIRISTEAIDAVITKQPYFSIRFKNKAGLVINEDANGAGFGTSFIGERSNLYKKMQPGERFIGLGEVLGNLDKRGNGYTLNNTDTYKYGDPRLPMYTNVPFYIGIHQQQVYGLFYHNTYKTFFNFGLSTPNFTSITADGGDVDYFFIYDQSIGNILQHYTALTGRMPMPPKWGIGFHQSRCSYFPDKQVEWIAESFRKKQIPIDCIVLDADYLQEYEPFRINKERFPDMKGMADRLKKLHIELTASVNPGIKIDSTYIGHVDGLKEDVFVKFADGSLYVTDIAPSTNHFVDFTNPKSRKWWADHMKFLPDNGIHGYWNDMNEPAVGGSYLPDNLVFNFDGHPTNTLAAKNLYGMLMARSSFESAQQYGGGRRPFVLSRSGFAGIQRYAAVWSGDNTAREDYLLGGVLLNTQMGLSGIPFVGDDIGGYIGNTSKELFARWIEVGAFVPFARNHKEGFAPGNEPWAYGEETEAIAKAYIQLRYQLMPYLYSAFYEAAQTGMPIARSLAIPYPHDAKVYDGLYQYQCLTGSSLLVVPTMPSEKIKKYYLPEGNWYNLHTDELLSGNSERSIEAPLYQLPVFVKAGAIIPFQSAVQSAVEKPSDTLQLHIYQGNESSSFTLYEDAGDGMQYQSGDYALRKIDYLPGSKQITIQQQTGNFKSVYKFIQLVIHGTSNTSYRVNNNVIAAQPCAIKLVDPGKDLIKLYDPAYAYLATDKEPMRTQQTITFAYTPQSILIQW